MPGLGLLPRSFAQPQSIRRTARSSSASRLTWTATAIEPSCTQQASHTFVKSTPPKSRSAADLRQRILGTEMAVRHHCFLSSADDDGSGALGRVASEGECKRQHHYTIRGGRAVDDRAALAGREAEAQSSELLDFVARNPSRRALHRDAIVGDGRGSLLLMAHSSGTGGSGQPEKEMAGRPGGEGVQRRRRDSKPTRSSGGYCVESEG